MTSIKFVCVIVERRIFMADKVVVYLKFATAGGKTSSVTITRVKM